MPAQTRPVQRRTPQTDRRTPHARTPFQTPADVDRLAKAGITTVFCLQVGAGAGWLTVPVTQPRAAGRQDPQLEPARAS
jgi:hypothetical protein